MLKGLLRVKGVLKGQRLWDFEGTEGAKWVGGRMHRPWTGKGAYVAILGS